MNRARVAVGLWRLAALSLAVAVLLCAAAACAGRAPHAARPLRPLPAGLAQQLAQRQAQRQRSQGAQGSSRRRSAGPAGAAGAAGGTAAALAARLQQQNQLVTDAPGEAAVRARRAARLSQLRRAARTAAPHTPAARREMLNCDGNPPTINTNDLQNTRHSFTQASDGISFHFVGAPHQVSRPSCHAGTALSGAASCALAMLLHTEGGCTCFSFRFWSVGFCV